VGTVFKSPVVSITGDQRSTDKGDEENDGANRASRNVNLRRITRQRALAAEKGEDEGDRIDPPLTLSGDGR
jgi:hypothetical protein